MRFSGCIYDRPERNKYAPSSIEDIPARDLVKLRVVGLPICVNHNTEKKIGEIVDQWFGPDDSMYITFDIPDDKHITYIESIKQQVYSHLSLGHDVDINDGYIPREVSICCLGRRNNTTIHPFPDIEAYKHITMSDQSTNQNQSETQQAVPMEDVEKTDSGETAEGQRIYEIISGLPESDAFLVSQAMVKNMNTAKDLNSQLMQEQKKALEYEKALETERNNNLNLKQVNESIAKEVVSTIYDAYKATGMHETEENKRRMAEIERATRNDVMLAQSLQNAIPVLMSAGGQKRSRNDFEGAPSHLKELAGFLRTSERNDGKYMLQQDRNTSVLASNIAKNPSEEITQPNQVMLDLKNALSKVR